MRLYYRYIALLIATTLTLGCTSYPQQGTGGLAESYASAGFSPVMPDEPLGPEHGLRFDWQLAKLHLDALIREGAKWCFPAAVVQALEKQNRIARELEGELLLDAANDLVIQRNRLNRLEQQLDYVTSQTRCAPPSDQNQLNQQLTVVDKLFKLLNVDNQFAFDSIEINPKFMGYLAQATHLLNEYPMLSVVVTGHADSTGSEEHNNKLAKGRAEQVKRYLTIFGLEAKRVSTQSLGDSLPLYQGDSPAVQLTNRRVSIEIISTEEHSVTPSLGGLYE
ncbi:OmpA family protein [Vibrio sp. SA48]